MLQAELNAVSEIFAEGSVRPGQRTDHADAGQDLRRGPGRRPRLGLPQQRPGLFSKHALRKPAEQSTRLIPRQIHIPPLENPKRLPQPHGLIHPTRAESGLQHLDLSLRQLGGGQHAYSHKGPLPQRRRGVLNDFGILRARVSVPALPVPAVTDHELGIRREWARRMVRDEGIAHLDRPVVLLELIERFRQHQPSRRGSLIPRKSSQKVLKLQPRPRIVPSLVAFQSLQEERLHVLIGIDLFVLRTHAGRCATCEYDHE